MGQKRTIATSASEERLEKLLEERLKSGANQTIIDNRIWDLFGETWCVMFTDLSGFSRGVAQFGIIHFLQTIYESQRILIPVLDEYDGILLKDEGDSFLVLFRNTNKAIQCAIQMQKTVKKYNEGKLAEEQILLCVGLGYGKILKIGDTDVFGSEVNAASKLGEDTAKAWDILVTSSVKENAETVVDFDFEEIEDVPPGADGAFRLMYSLDDSKWVVL
ncbi:adenylate/guanylate cyclase domain-containing protein [Leptospira ilyithenensis]|uniref:Adenylate/guanylate cyclase domain-containing protein n=1 Tax=Leptospira ilyithenensis TaxID=2484901 RepID=A0A4R9LQU3_9LEPT|nr:adenylate/guanylate cyclase domain-containing protein [Leptospira ilyithenensis]TGN11954.1 adenylate/guanylate cyclase domain-containing protein [Leptospira ilyithenensis]